MNRRKYKNRVSRIVACGTITAAMTLTAGCATVRLVSDYDEATDKAATALQKKISGQFLTFQSLDKLDVDLTYGQNKEFYVEVATDVNSMQVRASSIQKNSLTREQLKLLETNIALLALLHKRCTDDVQISAEQRSNIREKGIDLTSHCRIEYGADSNLSDRDQETLNPNVLPTLQSQFDQSLRAIIAFETAKREGRSGGED